MKSIFLFIIVCCMACAEAQQREAKTITEPISALDIKVATGYIHGILFSGEPSKAKYVVTFPKDAADFVIVEFADTGLCSRLFELEKRIRIHDDSCTYNWRSWHPDYANEIADYANNKIELAQYVFILNKPDDDGIYRKFKFVKSSYYPHIHKPFKSTQ